MNKYLLNGLYGLLGMIMISAIAFKIVQPIKVLPRLQLAPAFNLIDQNGQQFISENLRGQFVIFTFTYTQCPEPCFEINETIQEVQSRLGEVQLEGIPVTFVTISIDPERDTPEALNKYALSLGANSDQWKFGTTTNQALLKTIIGSGFETYYEKKDDGSFSFDPTFILVDGWGIVRAEYRYATEVSSADRILRHLGVLADEVRNSKGTTKLAYEAAHLFLCYAP
ncbi:MAG TPA: SCO family protein [Anaerolineales bacterium]|jgi:protein SCO1/2|nr:hypothetical protein [Anaerolineae bacterium]HRJ56763.1 SCO family protein [Anaerolineales bacterium]HRK90420.1 SCO family protein [Anaerolineales bacterium]